MEDVSDPQLKRDRPSPYAHPPSTSLHHMPPAETSALHNYHQPPPPGVQMAPQSHWNPTPSPYHENSEHRPPPHEHPAHSQSYPPQHYPPPSSSHPTDPAYHRHGSISAPSRSPPNSQQPPYSTPPVNGNSHEHPYYQQPPSDYRGRPSYGPLEGQPNGAQPPLHVTTNHEMMSGQPQSAPPLNHGPYSAGPPPGTPYQWPGYDPYGGGQRRKPVRAAQACDPCRSRKAKCDEGRPQCTHCKDNQLTCVYREVPPQKSEKQVLAITDKLEALSGNVDRMLERWQAQEEKINRILTIQESQGKVISDFTSKMPDEWSNRSQSAKTNRSNQLLKQEPRAEHAQLMLHQTSNLLTTATADMMKANNNEVREPASTTFIAAANLLSWPVIKQLIPKDQTASYVLDTESERGLLRLYGCGEGEDKGEVHDGAPSPATSSSSGRHDEDFSGLSPNGVWGTGQFLPPSGGVAGTSREHSGGLGPNGGLNLDSSVVDKYYYSYLDNMHKLHPFLETRVLRKMIHAFKRRYSWDFRPDHRAVSNIGGKRKREGSGSPNAMEDYSNSQPAHRPQPRNPVQHAPIEHSVANAIILLVLALGKICAYKDPLPGPVATSSVRNSAPQYVYSDLPLTTSASAPTSPYSAHTTMNGLSVTSGPNNPQGKNMDIIPGLAYFTKAADILGEMPGGVDVSHVQANLLAGLYMGQLARILPSHWYIRNACNACQIIIQSTPYREKKISGARRNLINFAFWSCLQLESDIIAEMEIPPSGIVSREASMWIETPAAETLGDPEQGDQTRIMVEHRHYLYQIQLRRTINDALKYVYNEDRSQSKPVEALIEILASNLHAWRTLIKEWDWDDDDHESADINVARMRGKYYGAKYIIHRPALYWALNIVARDPSTPASRPSESPLTQTRTNDNRSSPAMQQSFNSHSSNRRVNDMRPPPMKSYEPLEEWILQASQICVHSAIRSTTAFDKVPGRLIITNIFGTAHAQFGNVLVLAACHQSAHPQLRELVDDNTLRTLLKRTIEFLQKHEAISPTLGADARILQHVQSRVFPSFQPMSATSSFSSNR